MNNTEQNPSILRKETLNNQTKNNIEVLRKKITECIKGHNTGICVGLEGHSFHQKEKHFSQNLKLKGISHGKRREHSKQRN